MPPRLPRLPRLSEHLPPNPVKEVVQDLREEVNSLRQEVRSVADAIRIVPRNPQPFTAPRNTKTVHESTQKLVSVTKKPAEIVSKITTKVTESPETEPGKVCKPCEEMRALTEAVARRKVEKAVARLPEGTDKEVIRKYIGGEDVE
jgi:hypothetical protein